MTLLRGLIDSHVHADTSRWSDPPRFGVTTELGMFAFLETVGPFRHRRASTATAVVSDRWTAGILATVPGGHGTQFGPIPTLAPDAGKPAINDFVARRLAEGSDYIKVILDRDISAVRNIARIWRNGHRVDRQPDTSG